MALLQAEAIAALTRELALQAELVERTAASWTLRTASETLSQAGPRDRLQAALQQAGHAVALKVVVGPVQDSPAKRLAAAAAQRQREAEEAILNDPFVQSMLRDFGGKIVPNSIQPLR